jgi:uncharacterized membrane protein
MTAMSESLSELIHLLLRWVHLIAGIMWIGNSLLFNWLDRNLVLPPHPAEGLVGEIWMVHSGGFYEVEKKLLAPSQLPATLHWFKWQNGVTWLSGIALLIVVYYLGGAAYLTDPHVAAISTGTAVAVGLGTLVAAWLAYDLTWRSPLGRRPVLGFVLSLVVVVAGAAVLFRYLSGRAAYIHVGVMLGTLMTGNVWFVILPSQRELIAATKAGRAQDPALSYQAKQRSIHNNYMTFPLLFIMISNHFPSTYGHAWSWLVLLVLAVGSALLRHLMNIRFTYRAWLWPATVTFFVTAVVTLALISHPRGFAGRGGGPPPAPRVTRPVDFAEAQVIIEKRCLTCHAAKPTYAAFKMPPSGIVLETPEQIVIHAARIRLNVAVLRNMPLGNITQMSDDEREVLRAWIDQGAKLK